MIIYINLYPSFLPSPPPDRPPHPQGYLAPGIWGLLHAGLLSENGALGGRSWVRPCSTNSYFAAFSFLILFRLHACIHQRTEIHEVERMSVLVKKKGGHPEKEFCLQPGTD